MSTQFSSQSSSPQTRPGLSPLSSDTIIIGLALGSPTDNPLAPLPRDDLDGNPWPSVVQDYAYELDYDYSSNISRISYEGRRSQSTQSHRLESGLKRSRSRWKNLGGLFSRKTPSGPTTDGQPFYMLDRPIQREPAESARALASPEASTAPHKPRTTDPLEPQCQATCSAAPVQESGARAILRRVSTRKKGIRKRARAQTIDSSGSSRGSPARARLEAQGVPDEPAGASIWLRLDDQKVQHAPTGEPSVPGTSSLLQIEIPSVELERYSVMFGDLLLPNSPPSRPPRGRSQLRELKPALLEKENRTEKRTNSPPLSSNPPISSSLTRPPHKRNDSSSSTGSRSSTRAGQYGLFPSPSPAHKRKAAHKATSRPSPLSRSVTTPNITAASLPPPSIQICKSQDRSQSMVAAHEIEPPSLQRGHSDSRASGHRQPTSSFNPSDGSDVSIYASTLEHIDDFGKIDGARPPSANGRRREAPSTSAFPVRKSSMKAPVAPRVAPPPPCPQVTVNRSSSYVVSDVIGSDAEVSVARQISISRRRRNLVPVVPPQVVKQPMQAKLVNSCSTPALRSSHHLTLETVVDQC